MISLYYVIARFYHCIRSAGCHIHWFNCVFNNCLWCCSKCNRCNPTQCWCHTNPVTHPNRIGHLCVCKCTRIDWTINALSNSLSCSTAVARSVRCCCSYCRNTIVRTTEIWRSSLRIACLNSWSWLPAHKLQTSWNDEKFKHF